MVRGKRDETDVEVAAHAEAVFVEADLALSPHIPADDHVERALKKKEEKKRKIRAPNRTHHTVRLHAPISIRRASARIRAHVPRGADIKSSGRREKRRSPNVCHVAQTLRAQGGPTSGGPQTMSKLPYGAQIRVVPELRLA